MKTIYTVNDAGVIVSARVEENDYELKSGETTSIAPDSMFGPDFSVPQEIVSPSPEMQAINALGLVVAQIQAKEATSNV